MISPTAAADGKYNKIVLLFDAGETGSGEKWLFDDIFQMKGEGADPGPARRPARDRRITAISRPRTSNSRSPAAKT